LPAGLGVVPLPTSVDVGTGEVLLGPQGGLVIFLGETVTPGVADWFATWAHTLYGITVHIATAPDTGSIGLSAGPFDRPDLPSTAGIDPRPKPEAQQETDERYRLTAHGTNVTITAPTAEGIFRALTTLLQLITTTGGVVSVPDIEIHDSPAYIWRGLSLDVARHFFTVHEIEQTIDLLAFYKCSVLHLHLTDSEGWRLESKVRPLLTADKTEFYSQDEFRHLCQYAADRFVTIVPEIDLPGHSRSAIEAYPALQGPHEAAHLMPYLDPDVDEVLAFTHDVLTELATLAPGPFVHIGCDEPFGMPVEPYARFVGFAHDIVRQSGKRVVAWQEVTRYGHLTPDDVMQYWIGPDNRFDVEEIKPFVDVEMHPMIEEAAKLFEIAPEDVPIATANGVPVLLSSNSMLYLDRGYADKGKDQHQAELRKRLGLRAYQRRSLEQMFNWHVTDLPEIADNKATVAGVEAAMWGETLTSFEDLGFLLLPRLAGVAEKAWTHNRTTWADYLTRVNTHRPIWPTFGFTTAFDPADPADPADPPRSHPRLRLGNDVCN
jgi:hexosaminidase